MFPFVLLLCIFVILDELMHISEYYVQLLTVKMPDLALQIKYVHPPSNKTTVYVRSKTVDQNEVF